MCPQAQGSWREGARKVKGARLIAGDRHKVRTSAQGQGSSTWVELAREAAKMREGQRANRKFWAMGGAADKEPGRQPAPRAVPSSSRGDMDLL